MVVGSCTSFAATYVFGDAVVGGFNVCICFIIVCCIYFILVFCTVVATYCFNCANVVIALPGYVVVGLAVVWWLDSCLIASRAFSIYT